jgi:hypothetical protein
MGIEPGTNYPNPRTFEKEHGRVLTLVPGEKWRAAVTATWLTDEKSIAAEEVAIRDIQTKQTMELVRRPRPEWSAGG